ncbi:hypothetical protein BOX15_Mlig014531g3, partial [Macrostomum lignano]
EVDSPDEDSGDIPPEPVCRRLCDQFAEITGTDSAFALMMLQNNGWSLPAALDRCFGGDAPATLALPAAASSNEDPRQLCVMSWNLDGLTDQQVEARTRAAIAVLRDAEPHAVHLQEVAPDTLDLLRRLLRDRYEFVDGRAHPDDRYFTATLLRRGRLQLLSPSLHRFEGSRMDRTLLAVRVKSANGPEVLLLNTHLESTKDFAAERKRQLSTALRTLTESAKPALLAGDLNLRDAELQAIGGLPAGVLDAWSHCGARPEAQYTWDATRNRNIQNMGRARCRFDRMLAWRMQPLDFQLVGLQPAAGTQLFPSDHWGLVGLFQLQD